MAGLLPAPAFMGLITITSGTNDTLTFKETDGVTPTDVVATIPNGAFYADSSSGPESLATIIGDQMTAESVYSGVYVVAVSTTDGTITITASGGTLTGWYPMITTTETNKFLTGGDAVAGEQGLDHYGWTTDSVSPAAALVHTSDTLASNNWFPVGPVAGNTTIAGRDHSFRKNVSQVETLGHSTVTRAWEPRVAPSSTDDSEIIELEFQYLSNTDRTNYQTQFYSCYAFTGGKIRYVTDRDSIGTYTEVQLWGESLMGFAPSRLRGYEHFNDTIQLKRFKE